MAKPDLFRVLGCVVMVTLILVIAVKLSQQCTPKTAPIAVKNAPSATATPTPEYASVKQGHGVCGAGFRPDENGVCVHDY